MGSANAIRRRAPKCSAHECRTASEDPSYPSRGSVEEVEDSKEDVDAGSREPSKEESFGGTIAFLGTLEIPHYDLEQFTGIRCELEDDGGRCNARFGYVWLATATLTKRKRAGETRTTRHRRGLLRLTTGSRFGLSVRGLCGPRGLRRDAVASRCSGGTTASCPFYLRRTDVTMVATTHPRRGDGLERHPEGDEKEHTYRSWKSTHQ